MVGCLISQSLLYAGLFLENKSRCLCSFLLARFSLGFELDIFSALVHTDKIKLQYLWPSAPWVLGKHISITAQMLEAQPVGGALPEHRGEMNCVAWVVSNTSSR